MITSSKKQRFSSFTLRKALQLIGTNQLKEWPLKVSPQTPSPHYQQTVAKLKSHFDLSLSEAAKSLLIDAILMEAIDHFAELKIWKEAVLQTETLTGMIDYLIASQGKVYQIPLLCVVEAKKDDFEQGLAQCLVEMYTCRQLNQSLEIDVYGMVTNATAWQFYKLTSQQECYEYTDALTIEQLLGVLHFIFDQCVANLKMAFNQK